jgi:hypothetical protein
LSSNSARFIFSHTRRQDKRWPKHVPVLVHPAHHPHPTWRLKHGPAALSRETALTQLGAFHFCSPLSGISPRVRSARADSGENGKHALRRRNATSWSQQRHSHCCSSVAAGTSPKKLNFSILQFVVVQEIMDVEHLWHYEQSGGPSSRKARTAAELALLANTADDSSSSTNQDFLQVRLLFVLWLCYKY